MSGARPVAVSIGRYTMPAIALHWLMAVLLFAQIGIGWYMVDIPKRTPPVAFYYNLHKSLGLLAFALIAIRLWWKSRAPSPAAVRHSPALVTAARIARRLLYVCMVVTPLCGFIASTFTKHRIAFFGWPLPRIGSDAPLIHSVFNKVHFGFSYLLCALILLHLIAVLYHLARSGTGGVRRMLPAV